MSVKVSTNYITGIFSTPDFRLIKKTDLERKQIKAYKKLLGKTAQHKFKPFNPFDITEEDKRDALKALTA
jgi:hypothetical protein